MITWITSAIGRWTTPDPEEELMMAGPVITGNAGLILVGPPVLPGLPYFLASLGPVRDSSHHDDHTRGSRYLSDLLSGPIYPPVRADRNRLQFGCVENPEWYEDNAHLLVTWWRGVLSFCSSIAGPIEMRRSCSERMAFLSSGTLKLSPE